MKLVRLASWTALLLIGAATAPIHAQTTPGTPSAARRDSAGSMSASRDTARAGIRYLYLIRHGWYDADDPRDARIGKGLDSLGRVQARLTGERLAGLPVTMDVLVSSTYTRAMETADIVGESLHMRAIRDSLISECTPPSYRQSVAEIRDSVLRDTCQARLMRAWARYVQPAGGREDRHDVLVCHGNVIRWFVTKALGRPSERWLDYDIGNCSITAIAVRADGTMRLATFSDTGHLPPSLQTWTGRGAGWSSRPPSPPRPRGR